MKPGTSLEYHEDEMRFLTLVAALLAIPSFGLALTVGEVLKNVQEAEKEIRDARLKFTQETLVKGLEDRQELHGSLAIMKSISTARCAGFVRISRG